MSLLTYMVNLFILETIISASTVARGMLNLNAHTSLNVAFLGSDIKDNAGEHVNSAHFDV